MASTVSIVWRIEPVTPPRPVRHCSTCGRGRHFRSCGKIRLNANGRRLDAWLIYKCESCESTWNRPLVERAAVASIAKPELHAMHRSDPGWVREREFDIATLKRHCDLIDMPPDPIVTKTMEGDWPRVWSVIELAIVAQRPTGQRLDRLLAGELGISRSELRSMQRMGGLDVDSGNGGILRKPVKGRFALRFLASRLTECQLEAVTRNVTNAK